MVGEIILVCLFIAIFLVVESWGQSYWSNQSIHYILSCN